MSELAFNYKGKRFTPPSEATFWGVRRLRDGQRGVLDVVLDKDGLPLIVPIENGIDEFRAAVDDQPARYRLDALNAQKMAIANVEAAYVTVPATVSSHVFDAHESDLEPDFDDTGMPALAPRVASRALRNGVGGNAVTATAPYGAPPALPTPDAMSGVEYLLAEALRGQVQSIKQQGDAHTQQLGQLAAMVQSTLAAIPPLLLATTAHSEREHALLVELLLRREGITPPPPPAPSAPPPPAPVAPPPPVTPPPTFVYAMPRNAMFADEEPDDFADSDEGASDEDAAEEATDAQGEDFFTKATKLVTTVGQAVAPVAEVAKMVMGAGLGGLGGLLGGGDSMRNAAPAAPPAELASDEPDAGDPLAHLRVSHMLAVSYELGTKDGSIFRRLIRAMEPADRAMFTTRLCALPLDEAVLLAAEQVEWLKARRAERSHEACDAPTDDDAHETHDSTAHDASDLDTAPSDGITDCEHDRTAQDDASDLETAPSDDDHTDSEHGGTHRDTIDLGTAQSAAASGADAEPAKAATEPARTAMPPANTVAMTAVATTFATAPEEPRAMTPDVVEHLTLVTKHLRFPEIFQARALISNSPVAERNQWIARLMALAPAEAAEVVRAELARRAGP